jgi:hypothetical protein
MSMTLVTLAGVLLPTWLVTSQWVLLFALGFLIIVMYRQIGYLQHLKDQGTEKEGLAPGEAAPAFEYVPAKSGGRDQIPATARFNPRGQWSLLVFADPGCVSCQGSMLALERLLPKLERTMRVLVATSADGAQLEAIEAFRDASLAIGQVPHTVSSRLYRAGVTPYAYLIDPEGHVQARGVVGDEAAFRKLARQAAPKPVNVIFTVAR